MNWLVQRSYYKQSSPLPLTNRQCTSVNYCALPLTDGSGLWEASKKSSMTLLKRAGSSSWGAWPVFGITSSLAVPFRALPTQRQVSWCYLAVSTGWAICLFVFVLFCFFWKKIKTGILQSVPVKKRSWGVPLNRKRLLHREQLIVVSPHNQHILHSARPWRNFSHRLTDRGAGVRLARGQSVIW